MSEISVVILTLLVVFLTPITLLLLWIRARKHVKILRRELAHSLEKLEKIETRFSGVLNIEKEVELATNKRDECEQEILKLKTSYAEKKAIFDRLLKEIAIFDDRIAFAEMGFYQPHFDFDDSEKFKKTIENVRSEQKNLISLKKAVVCSTEWEVNGSKSQGATMTGRNIRLTLRAFNNECEAAIANTRWNNINAMEQRIIRAQQQIDSLNASNSILVTKEYLKLKLKELYLTHEYREKLKSEREERIELSRAAREEAKLLRDIEQAQREESKYEKLLTKARIEASKVTGFQLEAYAQKISLLEHDLAEAHAKSERAQAMAELTKSGYVYIISNVGSFGHDIVKIGLTRRLDPADRVRELGDASVPFLFDTHAIIYSEDAPSLERALHTEFADARVNLENMRKEFFKISLEAVEAAVARLAPSATFFSDIEAQEYHETLARRRISVENLVTANTSYPANL